MKLLIVDDHTVVREGLRRLLSSFLEAEILEAGTIHEAQDVFRAAKPEMVVLDLNLPGVGGLGLLQRLLAEEPRTRILVLSVHTSPIYVMRAMQAGARGYVSKGSTATELMEAIRQIIDGGRYVERDLAADLAANALVQGYPFRDLSVRELDILRLLAQGKSMSEISAALSISYKTVANICTSLKQKLMAERIGDLIRIAVEMHST